MLLRVLFGVSLDFIDHLFLQGAQKSFALWMLPIFQESDDERLIVKWSSLEDKANPKGWPEIGAAFKGHGDMYFT